MVKHNGTDFRTGTINYLQKGEIVDPMWDENYDGECGDALHLADSESGALSFIEFGTEYKLLIVKAKISDCRCFGGNPQYPMKLRARACELVKVVRDGKK